MVILGLILFSIPSAFGSYGDFDDDGFPDTIDQCPGKPENMNGYKDQDGCPDTPPETAQKTIPVVDESEKAFLSNSTESAMLESETIPVEILIDSVEPINDVSANDVFVEEPSLIVDDADVFDFDVKTISSYFIPVDLLSDLENIMNLFGTDVSFIDLIFYSIGTVAYGVFVWNFYRFLARREMIPLCLKKYPTGGKKVTTVITYILKYMLVFPLVVLVWFVVYSTFLFFMAPDIPTELVFLVVIPLVVTVRISAYYKEDLAKDFAKLIPFALLGIFLTSSVFFTTEQVIDRFDNFIPFLGKITSFVIYAVIVEAILRILFLIKRRIFPSADAKLEDEIERQIDEKIKVRVEQIEKKHDALEKKIEKETDDIEKKIEKNNKSDDTTKENV